ncbi:MAG: hypothetical protein ACLTYN_00930 [Dysosmobacter welbionis]
MEISEIRTAAPAEAAPPWSWRPLPCWTGCTSPMLGWPTRPPTPSPTAMWSAVLGISICKNLFLCNRQKTAFYLLTMPGGKPSRPRSSAPNWAPPASPSPRRS